MDKFSLKFKDEYGDGNDDNLLGGKGSTDIAKTTKLCLKWADFGIFPEKDFGTPP